MNQEREREGRPGSQIGVSSLSLEGLVVQKALVQLGKWTVEEQWLGESPDE